MIIFLSIIAGLSFMGTVAEGDENRDLAQDLAFICIASIVAIALIIIHQ